MEDLNDKIVNGGATADGVLASTDWNQIASEVQSVIEGVGIVLSTDLEQLGKAILQIAGGKAIWGNDSGSGTAYVLTDVITALGYTLFDGMHIRFRPANSNTSATPTINPFGLGIDNIVAENGGAIAIGDLNTNRDAELRFDGTNWRLLDRSKGLIISGIFPKGHIHGILLANGPVDTVNDIQFGVGECASDDGLLNLIVPSTIKRIDSPYAVGNNLGGFPTAITLTNGIWYRLFVIGGSAATTDCGFDTSATATNLLNAATTASGNTYDKFRHVGWVFYSSSTIQQFQQSAQCPEEILWNVSHVATTNSSFPGSSARITDKAQAPPNSEALMQFNIHTFHTSSREWAFWAGSLAITDVAPSITDHTIYWHLEAGNGDAEATDRLWIPVDGSSDYGYRFTPVSGALLGAINGYDFLTKGFRFGRGRL